MRVFCASLDHETNRHSPIPTGLDSFSQNFLYRPGAGDPPGKLAPLLSGANLLTICRDHGHECLVGLIAAAHPGAPISATLYAQLRDELLDDLRRALPVDAVMLRLHGAMLAQDCDDCEGDILARVRAIVGADVPVGVLFDLHGNVTDEMVDSASLLVACKEYPHTDFNDRALDLLRLLERTVAGECKPTTAYVRVPMVGVFETTREPMRSFVDRLHGLEADGVALSISVIHGFLSSDSPHVGAGVLVVTDADVAGARALAADLAHTLFGMREQIDIRRSTLAQALALVGADSSGPVIVADIGDNPGGGAAGDATGLLRGLLVANIRGAALALLHDPVAVDLCFKAGVGARLPLRVGGKTGPASGSPVDLDATVLALNEDHWQWAMGARDKLGRAAAVRANGVDVVLGSVRQQVLSPECFSNLGIDPVTRPLLVVKSAMHFKATFAPLAACTVFVGGTFDQLGASARNISRPLWPLDAPPFTAFGTAWS